MKKICVNEAFRILHLSPMVIRNALQRGELPTPELDNSGGRYWTSKQIEEVRKILLKR